MVNIVTIEIHRFKKIFVRNKVYIIIIIIKHNCDFALGERRMNRIENEFIRGR